MTDTHPVPCPLAFSTADDALVVTDKTVLDTVVARKALSVSTANQIAQCPAQWAAGKVIPHAAETAGTPIELDDSDPRVTGTAAHTVLERLMLLPAGERTRARAEWLITEEARRHFSTRPAATDREREEWTETIRPLVLGLWEIADPAHLAVVACEYRLDTTVEGIPMTGFVDLILRDDTGRVIIVDYKTGKLKAAKFARGYHDQLRIYPVAYREQTGHIPAASRLFYTGAGQAVDVNTSAQSTRGALTRFQDSWTKLTGYQSSGRFPAKTSPLCSWCELVNLCPAARREGYTNRSQRTAFTTSDLEIGACE